MHLRLAFVSRGALSCYRTFCYNCTASASCPVDVCREWSDVYYVSEVQNTTSLAGNSSHLSDTLGRLRLQCGRGFEYWHHFFFTSCFLSFFFSMLSCPKIAKQELYFTSL